MPPAENQSSCDSVWFRHHGQRQAQATAVIFNLRPADLMGASQECCFSPHESFEASINSGISMSRDTQRTIQVISYPGSWTFLAEQLSIHRASPPTVKVLLLFKSLGMVALKAQKTHANRQNTIKLRKLIFTNLTRPRNTEVCEIVTNLILYGFVYMGTNPIDYILWQIDKLQWYSVIEQYMQQEHVQSCCRFCDSWRSCCQRSVSGFGKWSKMFM